ncbi:MAG: cytidylate kinase-like family protein [Ignavibacteriaceae bacterium]|nr:cytidylate kinase-like family protein [Ignavibacteriaceae bacterium]
MIVKGALEKAKLYIESHSTDSDSNRIHSKQGPCITISRETGAGADKVSEALVDFFQIFSDDNSIPWTAFDKNLIEKILEDHHLPQKLSQYFIEDKLSELKSIVNELLGIHPHVGVLIKTTSRTILQLAQKGNVIIVGRAANLITTKLKNAFHIRLVAPFDVRVQHIEEIYNFNHKEAIEFTKKEDLARMHYVKSYFNKDINDPLLYHMIINTNQIPYKKAARMIGLAVLEKFPETFSINEERTYELV